MSTPRDRSDLRADCSSCAGLCCVVPAFTVSSDFAINKPSGVPCPNLAIEDFGCTIHSELRERGFPGCTVYDCFGAGQRVVQGFDVVSRRDAQSLAAPDSEPTLLNLSPSARPRELGRGVQAWRTSPEIREEMFTTFEVVERLHEVLWYLADAADRPAARPVRGEVDGLREAIEAAADSPRFADVVALQLRADPLLGEVSALVRAGAHGQDLRREDLAGRDLRSERLVAADLRGAVLIGTDLRGVDLADADLLGADLRGADVSDADLTTALFLTQFQVNAARGDARTVLPDWLDRPSHWDPEELSPLAVR